MRNIFDQYGQAENRLTHALISTLCEDRGLVRGFLVWLGVGDVPALKDIRIGQQQGPGGEAEYKKDGKEGLPDGVFYDDEGWAVLVEAKVQAGISIGQLRRHSKTAERYGYEGAKVVLIAVDKPKGTLPDGMYAVEWKDVYQWFCRRVGKSSWARRFVDYMQVFEAKMIGQDYNIKGTLTMFSGFNFTDDNPYTYQQGKRIIRLIGDEFRKDRQLIRKIGIDPNGKGRPKITKDANGSVWDFIPLKNNGDGAFTAFPHLTIVVRPDEVVVAVIVPNGIKGGFKSRLKQLGIEKFGRILANIEKNYRQILGDVPNARPSVSMWQRHYKGHSVCIEDGVMEIDFRTLIDDEGTGMKHQPMWLEAFYNILTNKRTNIQFATSIRFSYVDLQMQSDDAIEVMVRGWLAMKPMLDFVIKGDVFCA